MASHLLSLRGLVYALTAVTTPAEVPWYKRPAPLGIAVLAAKIALNLIFW